VTSAAVAGTGSLRVRTSANGLPLNAVPAISPRVSVTPGATPAAAGAAAFADQISPLPSPGQSWHTVLASGEHAFNDHRAVALIGRPGTSTSGISATRVHSR